MKREVLVLPEAEEELAAAAQWYEERRPGLGVQLVATVDAAVGRVVEAPLACPIWLEGFPYRKLVMQRFPYIVFFRLVGDDVEIVAFAFGMSKPRSPLVARKKAHGEVRAGELEPRPSQSSARHARFEPATFGSGDRRSIQLS